MLWHVALKFAIPWHSATTSKVILHVLSMLSCMSMKYHAKVPMLTLLLLGSEVIPIDVYHATWKRPTLSQK
jgi:hypothetical protein